MIKYVMKHLFHFLPEEMINEIYSFLDLLTPVKSLPPIWYERLITSDMRYYPWGQTMVGLKREETQFRILMQNKAFNIIKNIHEHNLNK